MIRFDIIGTYKSIVYQQIQSAKSIAVQQYGHMPVVPRNKLSSFGVYDCLVDTVYKSIEAEIGIIMVQMV